MPRRVGLLGSIRCSSNPPLTSLKWRHPCRLLTTTFLRRAVVRRGRAAKQHDVLASLLTQLQAKPRLTSIHSYRATNEVVEHLEHTPITGAILHWWLGDRSTTRRAVELGAYFSINTATLRRSDAIDLIPTDRLLLETDHPDWEPQRSPPASTWQRPRRRSSSRQAARSHHRSDPRPCVAQPRHACEHHWYEVSAATPSRSNPRGYRVTPRQGRRDSPHSPMSVPKLHPRSEERDTHGTGVESKARAHARQRLTLFVTAAHLKHQRRRGLLSTEPDPSLAQMT
ncbi:TatD family hydrolase [Ornithinimicrobium murale]|uniref:TatD family hydrolase n=1 Tax=Ornithinimicrobium murale TaxID=1050153 RepID=UPI003B51495A